MKRNLAVISALFLLGSLACVVSYQRIGSHVDPDGTLREPFSLIPIGWATGLAGIGTGLVALALPGRRRS
ncbi:DUF3955 domain-containing protein [Synechococcus sp. 1G10]|uniref:DUF3955 domain-containing protein n=1 Tax=Synechococcus sp. 1G10 TaxID=2025605 RepID=UPI001180B4C8|nr:DUF3955 domain-containing protein [Synechococcus sp. 1G10]